MKPAGKRLDAAVRERFRLSWNAARRCIEKGKVCVGDHTVVDIGHILAEGEEPVLVEDARATRPEDRFLPPTAILALDEDIVVVNKPAGLLTVPFESTDRDTLVRLVQVVLTKRAGGHSSRPAARGTAVTVVHRLDCGTSGALVFARTRLARARLKEQFRQHTVHRRYIALAHGRVNSTTQRSHLVRDRGDGLRGSVERAPERVRRRLSGGRIAITHIERLELLRGATLVACQLETGRTNQIRIHLSELGHPLVGETVYRRGHDLAMGQARRLCLHAAELGFVHPRTRQALHFDVPIPQEMQAEIDERR
jgi:23S rRNA pseudouridine1911/1915/1917 synthase